MKKKTPPSKKEQLVNTALDLFAKNGFHATGIDMILEKSGVSKRTMYLHFRSKEELILAVLHQYDGQFRNGFMRQVEAAASTPKAQLLAVFDVAQKWFTKNNFFGCMFINAIWEFSERDTSIRQTCKNFKQLMRRYIRALCVKAQVTNPDKLADEMALLLEGAIVTAQVSQKPKAAQIAKKAAEVLIEKATP